MQYDDYLQIRETAVQMVQDVADELAPRYDDEPYSLHVFTPLVDVLTAYLMLLAATHRLGGPHGVAYGLAANDAALVHKIARRVFNAAQVLYETSEIARAVDKAPATWQRDIECAFMNYIRTGDPADLDHLYDVSAPMAKRGRKLSKAALDRYVDAPARFW